MGKWAHGTRMGRLQAVRAQVCNGPGCAKGWCPVQRVVNGPVAPAAAAVGDGLHFQVSSRSLLHLPAGSNVLSLINKTITASRAWLMFVIIVAGPQCSYFCPNSFTLFVYMQKHSTSGVRESLDHSSGVITCPFLANSGVDSIGWLAARGSLS